MMGSCAKGALLRSERKVVYGHRPAPQARQVCWRYASGSQESSAGQRSETSPRRLVARRTKRGLWDWVVCSHWRATVADLFLTAGKAAQATDPNIPKALGGAANRTRLAAFGLFAPLARQVCWRYASGRRKGAAGRRSKYLQGVWRASLFSIRCLPRAACGARRDSPSSAPAGVAPHSALSEPFRFCQRSRWRAKALKRMFVRRLLRRKGYYACL